MAGDYNQGFVQVTIDGVTISDNAEFTEPEIGGSTVSAIMAGGDRGTGQSFSSLSNTSEVPFKVTMPSGDYEFLAKLAQTKRKVTFVMRYTDPTEFPDGEMTSFTTIGRLERKAHTWGREAEAREFVFKGVGYTMEFKNKTPLSVA